MIFAVDPENPIAEAPVLSGNSTARTCLCHFQRFCRTVLIARQRNPLAAITARTATISACPILKSRRDRERANRIRLR